MMEQIITKGEGWLAIREGKHEIRVTDGRTEADAIAAAKRALDLVTGRAEARMNAQIEEFQALAPETRAHVAKAVLEKLKVQSNPQGQM